ncbi:uncharacterized protein LOC134683131 isoform X1 [Mytilus trossulus]|uniref:uncharacterized protein LOC134683131 isoform X1 n=1 Tax=Mytilus trossulus TaxID=6551 RepID=UPI003007E85F
MDIYILISVFFCIDVFSVVGACRNCTQQGFMTIQESCKDSDQKLIRAQHQFSKENETSLCNFLFQFYYCVGDHVPACLQQITGKYARYYSSPFDCHPTPEVTLKLQNYMMKANDCSSKIPKDHETTVKYNIITSSQSSHMGKHNSLNSTNVAIKNASPSGTFLLSFSTIVLWYLDIL